MKQCHSDAAQEDRSKSGLERKRRNPFALIGLCCTGFCLVGLPLLGLAFSTLGWAWPGHGWLSWGILGVSLSMYILGIGVSFRHHRHTGPALVALVGAGVLVTGSMHLLPGWAEWVGTAVLVAAWFWDRRLHGRHHLILGSHVPPGDGGSPSSDRR
jgi:hypothetical protein